MRLFSKLMKKSEKGQVLVVLALTMIGLIAVIGLAVDTGYMYISYARLRRGIDAAGLAATGEFKRSSSSQGTSVLLTKISSAAVQMLKFNGIEPDLAAPFSDPTTGEVGVSVETCDIRPGDPALCKTPPQKLVRIKVQEKVPVYFLAVLPGFPRSFPIVVSSIAQAASVDVILLIDSSESMAWTNANGTPVTGVMKDPKVCNESNPGGTWQNGQYQGDCHPFQEVKAAAVSFIDRMYFPYDRVGLVSFNQRATVNLALTDTADTIKDAINNLSIYQGMPNPCQYAQDELNPDPVAQSPVPPLPYTAASQITGSCREMNTHVGPSGWVGMDCPMAYGGNPSLWMCGNTNTGEGFASAANSLAGAYPSYVCTAACPPARDDAVWVVIFLSDGAPNSAFDSQNSPICPGYTQTWAFLNTNGQACRDKDSSPATRHNSSSPLYDAGDYAHDMADFLAGDTTSGNGAYIFSVGMPGYLLNRPGWTGVPPAEELLKYAANKGADLGTPVDDQFKDGSVPSQLNAIFLAIANKIATRINQ